MGFLEAYNEMANSPNNFSYWYNKILLHSSLAGIAVPEDVMVLQVPKEIAYHYAMENVEEDTEVIRNWVKTKVLPEIPRDFFFLFIKNGTYSNKYDFTSCAVRRNIEEITRGIIEINYAALLHGAGGMTELVIRKRIEHDKANVPCIYNGMPLRSEFRVFYDFGKKKALYVVNYWDWDYCHDAICVKATDRIIYEHEYPKIAAEYDKRKDDVLQKVVDYMQYVDMSGIWSVDVMYDSLQDMYWIIDMAVAEQSAYWNPNYEKK